MRTTEGVLVVEIIYSCIRQHSGMRAAFLTLYHKRARGARSEGDLLCGENQDMSSINSPYTDGTVLPVRSDSISAQN
jgi:hypothetical protein